MAGVRFPAKVIGFSLLHRVQTGSSSHLESYHVGNGGLPLGVKGPGREADRSHPSSIEVKDG
jgi:hypothetical protein